MNIIFVCTGNTCRSPLAESVAQSIPSEHTFQSRGIAAYDGAPVSQNTAHIINREGLPAVGHAASFMDEDAAADLILTMSHQHKAMLLAHYPQANVQLLSEFAAGEARDIADPYGGDIMRYDTAYREISHYVQLMFEKLVNF